MASPEPRAPWRAALPPARAGERRPERFALSAARLAKISMVTGALLAALVMGVTLRVVRLQAHDEEWVSHTIEARQRIADLRALVRGAGSGTRVYLMTHAESYLDQYHTALQTIPVRLDELGELTADNAVQHASLQRVRPLIRVRLARLAEYLHGAEDNAAWLEESKRNLDEIRAVFDDMDGEEGRLLGIRREAARTTELTAELVSSLGILLSVVLVGLGWRLQQVHLRRETELMRLLHIGSRVSNEATCFRDGLRACLDQVCEATGWPAAHAHVLEGGEMVSSGLWHLPPGRDFEALRATMAGLRMAPGVGLAGKVMATARPGWFDDVSAESPEPSLGPLRAAVRDAGFRGVMALPIVAGDRVPAVVEFLVERRAAPDPALLAVLGIIGIQLGRVDERERAKDLAERQAKEIQALSMTDELTGLLNRRGFVTLGAQQIKLSRRAKERCPLFFMDMDGLKRINDQLGHAAGDEALARMAEVLRRSFRESDLVARLGGDEFVALAPGALGEVGGVEERVKENLKGVCAGDNPEYPLRISIGVSWVEPSGDTPLEEIVGTADSAMYERKRLRRLGASLPPKAG